MMPESKGQNAVHGISRGQNPFEPNIITIICPSFMYEVQAIYNKPIAYTTIGLLLLPYHRIL